MKKLMDAIDLGGRVQYDWLHYGDDGRKKITTETVQDVQPILDQNQREYNDAPTRMQGDFVKVATIPETFFEDFCKMNDISFSEMMLGQTEKAQALWNKLLNDRDLSKLRTHPGHVDFKRLD